MDGLFLGYIIDNSEFGLRETAQGAADKQLP
jgi:hypothetical protein